MGNHRLKTPKKPLTFMLILALVVTLMPVSVHAADRGEWAPNVAYAAGDTVTYQGQTYTCLQSHTSLLGWEPSNAASLWQAGGNSGGGGDAVPPSAPGNLTVTATTANSVSLSWSASTDNVGVAGYDVYRNGAAVGTTNGLTATVSGLGASTTYTFHVRAKDAAGNLSANSNTVTAVTQSGNTGGGSCSEPAWSATAVYTGGARVSYDGKIYQAQWWTQGDRPDLSGQWGVWRYVADCQVGSDDTQPPTAPTNLSSPSQTSTSVTLHWSASADNVGVVGYDVFRNNVLAASVTSTNATVTGLTPATAYTFTVKAKDAAGNVSAASAAVTVATEDGDTPPPPGDRRYVTYASTWNTSLYDLTTANIPDYITNVNLAFVRPDTHYVSGSYEFDQAGAGFEFVEGAATPNGQKKLTAQQQADLRNNIAALEARGTEVWISVGGWSYSQGSQWSNFNAANVVSLALDLGASGVDIDWESSGSSCNKLADAQFSCSKDGEIAHIITSLHNEIQSRGADLGISIAGWSTGAYYVAGTPFEEGKVQWGSPFGGTMYRVVKDHGDKIDFINLMSYDAGEYYDPREGYESYRAIYDGPINMGMEIAPEGSGGAILELHAPPGTVYDADMLTGQNNIASQYYNVETMVNYIKNKGEPFDGFMLWQLWKQRVHQPAPAGAATENSAGQYVCLNLPLAGTCSQTIPNLPKLSP